MEEDAGNGPAYQNGHWRWFPAAIAEVTVYGGASAEDYNSFTGRMCDILDSVLDVPADRVYVKYAETEHWGWNGSNF